MKLRESLLLAGASSIALTCGGCAVTGNVDIDFPSVSPSASATTEFTPIANPSRLNILSAEVCAAVVELRTQLGPDGSPFVITDEKDPKAGVTIANGVADAVEGVYDVLLITDTKTGERLVPADAASMDAFTAAHVAETLVPDINGFLDGKTSVEATNKENKPMFDMIQGETEQSRQVVTEALAAECAAEQDPYKK